MWDAIYARRLARSHLDERAPAGRIVEIAREVLGVHAQLPTGAVLALSARVEGVTRELVDDLLWRQRALVKGNTVRGTLHLQTPGDFALWRSAYEPRWRTEMWLNWQKLSLRDAEYLREAVLAVLDEPRTREEVGTLVGGAFGRRIAEDSWGHLLSPANDSVCHGPPRGRKVTFVRADAWLSGFEHVDMLDALQQLTNRFVATYGPVERKALEHWFARKLPPEIEIPDAGAMPEARPRGVRLLYHYDVYVIACHPRDHLIPEHKERVFSKGAGPNPTLLVDGRVRGVWTRDGGVEPFIRLTKAQQTEVDAEWERVQAALR